MPDIFLYPGNASPGVIILSDPTKLRSGAASLAAVIFGTSSVLVDVIGLLSPTHLTVLSAATQAVNLGVKLTKTSLVSTTYYQSHVSWCNRAGFSFDEIAAAADYLIEQGLIDPD